MLCLYKQKTSIAHTHTQDIRTEHYQFSNIPQKSQLFCEHNASKKKEIRIKSYRKMHQLKWIFVCLPIFSVCVYGWLNRCQKIFALRFHVPFKSYTIAQ